VKRGEGPSVEANEAAEFSSISQAISAIEHSHDVVVIDTPGNDTHLMRLAHSMADTLVMPLNDSFLDFDVLAAFDPTNFGVTGESQYAEMVREAKPARFPLLHRSADAATLWPGTARYAAPRGRRKSV